MALLASLGHWNWFILAALLLLLELIVPGAFMIWLGIGALIVGLVSLVVDWGWQAQIIAFGVLAIVAVPLWRRVSRGPETSSDSPFLNRRAEGYVGREFVLEHPIVNGAGTLSIDDTIYRITGPDLPAGSRVKITRADSGSVLAVMPV
jgi:membrane protein implicated in regulation of membrane protease activity